MREVTELTDKTLEYLSQLAMLFSDKLRNYEDTQFIVIYINAKQAYIIKTREENLANLPWATNIYNYYMNLKLKSEEIAQSVSEGKMTATELVTTQRNLLV